MAGNPFKTMFRPSPIRPIQEHIGLAHQCAEQQPAFLDAWQSAGGKLQLLIVR